MIVDQNKPIVMSNGQYHIVLGRTFVQRLPEPYSNCKTEFTYAPEIGSFPYFQRECFRRCLMRAQQTACGLAANFTTFEHLIHVNEKLFDQTNNLLLRQCNNQTALSNIQAEFAANGIIFILSLLYWSLLNSFKIIKIKVKMQCVKVNVLLNAIQSCTQFSLDTAPWATMASSCWSTLRTFSTRSFNKCLQ